jgi:radical SAM superfamily enzyme YgiQ (UPF0313 family)
VSTVARSTVVRRLLLVNPLIHDLAAYDFWARPSGLLVLAGALRAALPGARLELELLDCTDPRAPDLPASLRPRRRPDGRGRFVRTPLETPPVLPVTDQRRFSRYGLPPAALGAALARQQRPDLVLVGSTMTYWYTGVAETVALIRQAWPGVQVVLGGAYATLCTEHAAAHSGADVVLGGPAFGALPRLAALLGLEAELEQGAGELTLERCLPAHDLSPEGSDAAPLLSSTGCPHDCAYCAVRALHPRFEPLSPQRVEREVAWLAGELGLRHAAIYDDALLTSPARALEIFERVARLELPLSLHAASGLACRGIDAELARAMRRAGLVTVRLGLETVDAARLDRKVSEPELHAALSHLQAAGYARREVGVYVMVGLPGQTRAEVERALDLVLGAGARPHLAEYSPIPGSPLFAQARAASHLDLDEPLHHNPTLLPCAGPDLDGAALGQIKLALKARLA